MKKLSMIIICLMAMVSVNAQGLEFTAVPVGGKNHVKMAHSMHLTFDEKVVTFGPELNMLLASYDNQSTILSKNGIEPIIKFLETILAKAQSWKEICNQGDVNNISKTIELTDGVKFCFDYRKNSNGYSHDEITIYKYFTILKRRCKSTYLQCSVIELAEIISELKTVDMDSIIFENAEKEQRYKELYDKLI